MKFSRRFRLTSQRAFRFVFDHPVVSQDRYFRILGRANGLQHSRLGLAVSRKCCRHAVDRNRLKRLTRESFRTQCLDREAEDGLDVVVLPKPQAVTMCNRTLLESLASHWPRLRTAAAAERATSGSGR